MPIFGTPTHIHTHTRTHSHTGWCTFLYIIRLDLGVITAYMFNINSYCQTHFWSNFASLGTGFRVPFVHTTLKLLLSNTLSHLSGGDGVVSHHNVIFTFLSDKWSGHFMHNFCMLFCGVLAKFSHSFSIRLLAFILLIYVFFFPWHHSLSVSHLADIFSVPSFIHFVWRAGNLTFKKL